jgi:ketosteroid isomerase-like protein
MTEFRIWKMISMTSKRFCIICIFFLCSFTRSEAQQQNQPSATDSLEVIVRLNQFLEALRNLEFDKFQSFFSKDVTVFFPPSAHISGMVAGKDSVMKVFSGFFQNARKNKEGPPYLDITPEKLMITIIQSIALVTFEVKDPGAIGRRTVIMKKEAGKYEIIHLHASREDLISK